jgi:hypothetical protein
MGFNKGMFVPYTDEFIEKISSVKAERENPQPGTVNNKSGSGDVV